MLLLACYARSAAINYCNHIAVKTAKCSTQIMTSAFTNSVHVQYGFDIQNLNWMKWWFKHRTNLIFNIDWTYDLINELSLSIAAREVMIKLENKVKIGVIWKEKYRGLFHWPRFHWNSHIWQLSNSILWCTLLQIGDSKCCTCFDIAVRHATFSQL